MTNYQRNLSTGFNTDRDTFLGAYNGGRETDVVLEGQNRNPMASGWYPIASHCLKLELQPGESKELVFFLGYIENEEDKKWASKSVINKEACLIPFWKSLRDNTYGSYYGLMDFKHNVDKMKRIMDVFAEKVYNPELHRQEVFFDDKWNSTLDLHPYGHDIETAWLIDRGVEVVGEADYVKKMTPITKDLTRRIYEWLLTVFHCPMNVAETMKKHRIIYEQH